MSGDGIDPRTLSASAFLTQAIGKMDETREPVVFALREVDTKRVRRIVILDLDMMEEAADLEETLEEHAEAIKQGRIN